MTSCCRFLALMVALLSMTILRPACAISNGKYAKCNICPIGQSVTLPLVVLSIQNTTLSCAILELAGQKRLISPTQCNGILLTSIPTVCGCKSKHPVKTPVARPVKKPVKVPVKKPVKKQHLIRDILVPVE